jgi:ribosomal protein S18 acetylase RimI-like enzyme
MVRLRNATLDDADEIVALWHELGAPTRTPAQAAHVVRLIERDPDALIVAVDDGHIVGSIVVGWDGWRCHLYRLVVRPEVRRRGIAGVLVAAALRRAAQLGAARVDAMVLRENGGATAFWHAAGFELQDDDCRWSVRI